MSGLGAELPDQLGTDTSSDLGLLPGSILLDRGLLPANCGSESPRSRNARDRGHRRGGFGESRPRLPARLILK